MAGEGYTLDNEGVTIHLDHKQMSGFVDEKLSSLHERLAIMMRWNDAQLLKYISPLLDEDQKKLEANNPDIKKILDFRRFQIEKAAALMEDVIKNGHIGGYFDVDVNRTDNGNGLSVKEMIALCYNATKDIDHLIVGNKLDENDKIIPKKYTEISNAQEQEDFLATTEFKFITGLYNIRRGYNIDYGQDNPDTYIYTKSKDLNVCAPGTINRLPDSINYTHEDIQVDNVSINTLKQRILKDVPNIINTIIDQATDDMKPRLAFALNEWKTSNKMPLTLQNQVNEVLKAEFATADNPIFTEFSKFFTSNEIAKHTIDSLESFPYPTGKLKEIPVTMDIKTSTAEQIISHLNSLPKYTKDAQGNHQLTIVAELQKNPELMITLLEKKYNLDPYFVLKDNKMLHIVSDWLENHDELLLNKPDLIGKAIAIAQHNSSILDFSVKNFFASQANNFDSFVEPIGNTIKADPDYAPWIIRAIPEGKFNLFVDHIVEAMKAHPDRAHYIIEAIPKDEFDQFVKHINEAIKAHPYYANNLIRNTPPEKFNSFVGHIVEAMKACPDVTSGIIPTIPADQLESFVDHIGEAMQKANPAYVPNIIKAIPKDKLKLFVEHVGKAIIKVKPDFAYGIIRAIPVGKLNLFVDVIGEVIKTSSYYTHHVYHTIQAIPEDELHLFEAHIAEAMKTNLNNALSIIRAIPVDKLDSFVDVIGEAMKINRHYALNIIKAIPVGKLDSFVDVIGEVIKTNPDSLCHAFDIITTIPVGKLDSFVDVIGEAMKTNRYNALNIIKAIPENKLQLFEAHIGETIANIIKGGSGWVYDDKETWNRVADIIRVLPEGQLRISIMSEALGKIDNTSRRDRLLDLLPENERSDVISSVRPTLYGSVREFLRQMNGDQSSASTQHTPSKNVANKNNGIRH